MRRTLVREDDEAIKKGQETQEKTRIQMVEIAKEITGLFDEAHGEVDELKSIIGRNHDGMREIAGSSGNTAAAVTEQSHQIADIHEQTEVADAKRNQMVEMSESTQKAVIDGTKVIDQLKDKTANVVEMSDKTVASTKAVTEKVEKVEKIVGVEFYSSNIVEHNLLAISDHFIVNRSNIELVIYSYIFLYHLMRVLNEITTMFIVVDSHCCFMRNYFFFTDLCNITTFIKSDIAPLRMICRHCHDKTIVILYLGNIIVYVCIYILIAVSNHHLVIVINVLFR